MAHDQATRGQAGTFREAAREFRDLALEIDVFPERIVNHLDLPGVRWLSQMHVPTEFRNPTHRDEGTAPSMKCSERVVMLEHLAYGDIGVLLASPGPSLSGHVIADLGTPEQKETYFSALLARPTWTFFALSEPTRGSDAANLTTGLTADPTEPGVYRLSGEKYFIGSGARASMGVVFVRRSAGPLGIDIVFLRPPLTGFSARVLPTLGIRGASLAHLKFDQCRIEKTDLVGHHLNPSRRGLWGAIQTFNRFRPGLAAMALGVAQATYDYIVDNRQTFRETEKTSLDRFAFRLQTVRATVQSAAVAADADPSQGTLASMAKVMAVDLVEDITEAALPFFGPGALLDHPFLNKWYRDARGFEYMEGTSHIHRLKVGQAFALGKLSYD